MNSHRESGTRHHKNGHCQNAKNETNFFVSKQNRPAKDDLSRAALAAQACPTPLGKSTDVRVHPNSYLRLASCRHLSCTQAIVPSHL